MIWNEFLDTGKRLLVGATEGDWRSAASRAYYAVFHYSRDWLQSQGIDLGPSGQAHNSLYVGLANCGILMIQNIGDRIDELRRTRTKADYDLNRRFSKAKSVDSVREADEIIMNFEVALRGSPSTDIINGVRDHLISIGRLPRS